LTGLLSHRVWKFLELPYSRIPFSRIFVSGILVQAGHLLLPFYPCIHANHTMGGYGFCSKRDCSAVFLTSRLNRFDRTFARDAVCGHLRRAINGFMDTGCTSRLHFHDTLPSAADSRPGQTRPTKERGEYRRHLCR
jgi:hypothetical protein